MKKYEVRDDEHGIGKVLILKTSWDNEIEKVLLKNDIRALRLSESAGYKDTDLSFISSLDYLKSLEIYSWDIKDVSPINKLNNLEVLGLQTDCKRKINVNSFSKLRVALLTWKKGMEDILNLPSIEYINISGFPFSDLNTLKRLHRLKKLYLTSRKLESLKGIKELKDLEILDFAYCPKIDSLKGIQYCNKIKSINLYSCKKITKLSSIEKLQKLKRVSLENMGIIETMNLLKYAKSIEELFFVGETTINDGDLSFLLEMPNLKKIRFAKKRHYSHTWEQIEECITNR